MIRNITQGFPAANKRLYVKTQVTGGRSASAFFKIDNGNYYWHFTWGLLRDFEFPVKFTDQWSYNVDDFDE